jgi:hypothetical protein
MTCFISGRITPKATKAITPAMTRYLMSSLNRAMLSGSFQIGVSKLSLSEATKALLATLMVSPLSLL